MSTITAAASLRAPSLPATSASSKARVAALVDTATRVANPPSDMRLPPPQAPTTAQPVSSAARSFAESVSAFDVNHMNIGELSSDSLTAAFLKLNISDPNENVETHDALYTAASNLRQAALDEEEKENDRVEELQQESTKYAEATTKITGIMKISNTLSKALISASPLAAALIGGASQIGLAVLDSKNKAKELTLAEARNQAARTQVTADEQQDMVQNESDIVNTIMEAKNDVVDAVEKMIDARGTTAQKLMAAAIGR